MGAASLPVPLPNLTPDDVGERYGVTGETVRGWIRAGRLPAVRLPSGHYRISEADLWLAFEPARRAPDGREVLKARR